MATGEARRHSRAPGTVAQADIGRGLTVLLAVACGLVVANLYYAQPLLHVLATSFGTSSSTAASIVTATQLGYAAGLLLLVPLGDLTERRRLVTGLLLVVALALLGSAAATGVVLFEIAAVAVGVTSVVAQILVPLAADLARPARRGRVVGAVMSGLLLGILLARTASGLLEAVVGWRGVYLLAAVAMVVLSVVLLVTLPRSVPNAVGGYGSLLRSTIALFRGEVVLRRRAAFGALGFAAFSVLWTTLAFLLSGPPYRYSSAVIGLFGLAGAAGAVCASFAGRLADRGFARRATAMFALAVLVAFILIALGRQSLAALLAGIVVLDIGVQGMQITNQSLIYRLRGDARSRINSAYMTCYFLGGSAGSAAAGAAYQLGGWRGVCLLGGVLGLAMVLLAFGKGRAYEREVALARAAPAQA